MNDKRPYLTVRIFGREFKALLDSGASQTILGKEGLCVLNQFPARLRECSGKYLEVADSFRHNVTGIVTLPLTLKGKTECLDVLVVPTLPHTLILGVDFWDAMHIVPNVHHRRWDFGPQTSQEYCFASEGKSISDHLSKEERKQLEDLVNQHFQSEPLTLGRTDKVKHTIDTGNAPAVKQRYYPLSPARQKLVNEELDRMLELGIVEPSKSDWSSPILLLDKPDGSRRFCVDFRKVNQVSKKDAYPLPMVSTILDRLRGARYLSSLDIKSAYWQIPLEENSKEKTAFTIPGRGLFQFNTMPFGLSNAPATWQRLVDNVLGVDLEPFVFVYLDDIIAVTPTFEQHLQVLSEIFTRVREAKLTLNKDKCKFCLTELRYLGYIVGEKGLRVDPDKVKSILELPVPKNQKEVRQFCGTAGWYRRFIPNFASRMYPLTTLLKKRQKFDWNSEAQSAFEDIRSCLVSSPVLSCPDFNKPFTIACDASNVGVGAVLSQDADEGEVVVAYGSRTLSRQEQNYSTTERECLAVIWAVERFRPYIEGTKFKIITDHYSLLWLNNLKDPQGRLARWALRLQPYDFELVHRKGKENVVADLLSRAIPETEALPEATLLSLRVPAEVKDKWYKGMLEKVVQSSFSYPQWKMQGQELWKHVEDRWRSPENDDKLAWKLVLPKELRGAALKECHDEVTAGHLGSFKTLKRVQSKYYWPKMRADVAKYVSKCLICQQMKGEKQKPGGLMGERRGMEEPWQMIAADLMGPFPRSMKGFKYILVVTDTFSKYSILIPLRSATSQAVAKHIEEDLFMIYGVPRYFISDNGSEFTGNPMKSLLQQYKVKAMLNASRHPQANPTERVNQTIGTMLRTFVGNNHRHWDRNLAHIGFALRTAVHETTGYSPAFLMFGRELTSSGDEFDVLHSEDLPPVEGAQGYSEKLKTLRRIYQEVSSKLKEAHQRGAARYNLRRRNLEFKVEDLVWKRNFAQSDAAHFFSAKLTPKYVGPFVIASKVSPTVYSLRNQQGKLVGNWHVSDLKPYKV